MKNWVYIATAPCGCVHGIDFEDGAETHEQLARWIREGSKVEQVPENDARLRLVGGCPHEPKWGRS